MSPLCALLYAGLMIARRAEAYSMAVSVLYRGLCVYRFVEVETAPSPGRREVGFLKRDFTLRQSVPDVFVH